MIDKNMINFGVHAFDSSIAIAIPITAKEQQKYMTSHKNHTS